MQIEKHTTSRAEETTPELRLLRVVERHRRRQAPRTPDFLDAPSAETGNEAFGRPVRASATPRGTISRTSASRC
jgi:hypothetical protein